METGNKNYFEILGQSIRSSVTLKLVSIFILMLLLMIPISFIQELIRERESFRQETVTAVSSQWANEQLVYGPILTIPVQKKFLEDGKPVIRHSEIHMLPASLLITGSISPEKLHRGIYDVVVYDSHLTLTGKFENIQQYLSGLDGHEVLWADAFLTINISDLRGIQEKVVVNWDGHEKDVDPGSPIPALVPSGFTVKDILQTGAGESHSFQLGMKLQGSRYLNFIPLGKETAVHLDSPWQDPSFSGAFLPDSRNVSEKGFKADWKVLELNRNFPQSWTGNSYIEALQASAFGVDLLLPVSGYQKSMRSAKYALLAISLTFLTFFLIEIFSSRKVHPFQYILIGLALCLFYTLLVAISEHLNFNLAYLISSIFIIGLIGLYARYILPKPKQVLGLVSILCFTYTFVFVTLQVQDYALLIGSIGLTLILAFTMYITRHVNWYELSSTKKEPSRIPTASGEE